LRYQTALALRTIDPAADLDPVGGGESRQQVEQEVERLLIAAKGENPDAMLTLASIGPAALPAIPEIVAAMGTAVPEQRTELAALLTAISTEGMVEVPPLIAALQTGAPAARARAAERLGRIGADAKQAVPALTGGLGTEDLEMRFALAEALGEIGGHTTATTRALVAAAAGDSSGQVRREATESLRREARAALEAEGVSTRRGLYEIDRALTN
jgi:HEAT repeat protein